MATASAKKSLPRRTISTTPDSGEIIEKADDAKISLTATSDVESDARVTVVVPKQFTLTRDDGTVKVYHAGTQEMPEGDAQHWFAKASGVQVYAPA